MRSVRHNSHVKIAMLLTLLLPLHVAALAASTGLTPAAPQHAAHAHAAAGASPPFPESRLITAAHGAQLNEWANRSAGQKWELCYTSFTMDKSSAAEFHSSCDQYTPTYSVAHNSGGKPGKCEGKCDDEDNDWAPCTPVGSDCSSATRGQGVCVGRCSSALGPVGTEGCSANGTASGTPCPGPPKLNSTFGGFVRPCI